MSITDEIIIISQTVSPKNYCKKEHISCEFANDMGYCMKTGCSKRIINEKPIVNYNLVEKERKMREALSKLIANMVYLGATEEEIVKVIHMSKELIDYEKKYGELNPFLDKEQITTALNTKDSSWASLTDTNYTN